MTISLRQIAAECGVSTATVSRALAGHPYVARELRERIATVAADLGYQRNRLVGSLMAHVRRVRTHRFVGNLAIVHVPSPRDASIGPQERVILESARSRARELGFSAGIFELRPDARGEATLARMLRSRGVTGVLFVYPHPREAPQEFPWGEFAVLALDLARTEPQLNTVCHDQFASMTNALARLHAAGYRRPGLFVERFKDARTNFKWSAAFRSFQWHSKKAGQVPVLVEETMNVAAFEKWHARYEPDVVLGHFDDAIGWLEQRKRSVPADVGFFHLNWLSRTRPCAGIDPQLELQGRVAADALISQVQHGERGLPATPRFITVPGKILDGPSICAGAAG